MFAKALSTYSISLFSISVVSFDHSLFPALY
jgi:hypothetical protein